MKKLPAPPSRKRTPEEERKIREAALDKTIMDSFPASDPPSTDPNPDQSNAVLPSGSRCGFSPKPITRSPLKPITRSPRKPISVLL
jgi:hypothetical protein